MLLRSPDHTQALAAALGRLAPPNTVIALDGELGAGKTCFAQGLAAGLGVKGPVVSPTFQILAIYEGGRLPLHHADLYRLGDESELQELGLEDSMGAGGVMVIEWASRFPDLLPQDHLALRLSAGGSADERHLHPKATGPGAQALLDRWMQEPIHVP